MKIVAITSCSTGIAHTYMAAESIAEAAKEMGIEIKVETQGSIGAENVLTEQDIKEADAVLISANTGVNKDRFVGKKLYETNVEEGIKIPKEIIKKALETTYIYKNNNVSAKTTEAPKRQGVYKHLMAGVSYMIPFVVAGGICIALAFAFGGINSEGALAAAFMQIGGGTAFTLMLPILAGFIAFSIADRPGILPGMVGGAIANSINAGFLGALIAGFLSGYLILLLKKYIKLPKGLEGMMPILVLPLISTVVIGLTMIFIVGKPFAAINTGISNWLASLSGVNSVVLGMIIGFMMAIDMAGPIGKAAYFFGVASLTALKPGETSIVMAATMATGMVPPLAMSLATLLDKKKFNNEEIEAGKTAWLLGISFITEGCIPFAAGDPLRVLPSVAIGSAVTGALSMLFKCGLAVPHGGVFVLPIPGAVSNLLFYIVSIAVGTVVAAFIVLALKKNK